MSGTSVFDAVTETADPRPPAPEADHAARRFAPGDAFGCYRIVRLLGQGGMGDVYEATDVRRETPVALKVSRRPLDGEAERSRFLEEGKVAASISHPHIVYVLGVDEIDDVPIIVTELVPGGTLRDRVERTGPLAPSEAVDVVLQIASGLQALADAGLLHRDVKPSNCFLDRDGRVKVGDFGLATSTRVRDDTHVSSGRKRVGTIAFASPEQLRGDPLDVRADIYSLGATLHYLLTGREPFVETHYGRLVARVLQEPPPRVRRIRPDAPRALDRILRQCLAKDARHRPRSYAELVQRLRPYGTEALRPAALGLRALAGFIDAMILRVSTALLVLAFLQVQQRLPASAIDWLVLSVLLGAGITAYFSITEAIWSGSPGKLLAGLRVVAVDGQPAGWLRLGARAAIWSCSIMLPASAQALWLPSALASLTANVVLVTYASSIGLSLSGFAVLFSAASRRNGFAGLHDLATGIRVVYARAAPNPNDRLAVGVPNVAVPPDAERLGPYLLLEETALPGLIVGFDQVLERRVWIRRVPSGTPPISRTRQDVARPTRLRWIAGSRDENGVWDAYEAPSGEPLTSASHVPAEWVLVRQWLLALAEEWLASRREEHPPAFVVSRVWIAGPRAVLVDCPPEARGAGAPESGDDDPARLQSFLLDVAARGLAAGSRLPLHARELLSGLASRAFASPAAVLDALRPLSTRPASITIRQRAVHLAVSAFPVFLSLVVIVPVLALLLPLLARSPGAFVLDGSLRRLDQLAGATTPVLLAERHAIETLLVGRFRPLLERDGQRQPWYWPLIEWRRPLIDEVLRRRGPATHEEVLQSEHELALLLDGIERQRLRASQGVLGWRTLLFVVLLLLTISAFVSAISASVTRGGALFRWLGIAVSHDGALVSRRRALARALLAWAPAVTAFVLLVAAAGGPWVEDLALGALVPSLAFLGVFIAGAAYSLRNPHRGVQDALTRSTLVPR